MQFLNEQFFLNFFGNLLILMKNFFPYLVGTRAEPSDPDLAEGLEVLDRVGDGRVHLGYGGHLSMSSGERGSSSYPISET